MLSSTFFQIVFQHVTELFHTEKQLHSLTNISETMVPRLCDRVPAEPLVPFYWITTKLPVRSYLLHTCTQKVLIKRWTTFPSLTAFVPICLKQDVDIEYKQKKSLKINEVNEVRQEIKKDLYNFCQSLSFKFFYIALVKASKFAPKCQREMSRHTGINIQILR